MYTHSLIIPHTQTPAISQYLSDARLLTVLRLFKFLKTWVKDFYAEVAPRSLISHLCTVLITGQDFSDGLLTPKISAFVTERVSPRKMSSLTSVLTNVPDH